jgi:hypothetical protein
LDKKKPLKNRGFNINLVLPRGDYMGPSKVFIINNLGIILKTYQF